MSRRYSLSTSPSSSSFDIPRPSVSRSASLDALPSHFNHFDDNDFPHLHFDNEERNDERQERQRGREREMGKVRGPPAASRPASPSHSGDDSPPPFYKNKRSMSLPSGTELQRFHDTRENHVFAPNVVSNKEIKEDAEGYIKHELIVAVLAEIIGTAILVGIGTGVILSTEGDLLAISITWGFVVFGLIIAFGAVSGAHFNPTVTIAFFILNCRNHFKSQLVRLVAYIISQMIGATLGAAFTYSMLPGGHSTFFGTRRGPGVSIAQAYFIEAFITFILIFNAVTVYHNIKKIADKEAIASNDVITAPFATAFIVTLDVVYAGPYTGASLNPARTFGPALVLGIWDDHWLYWCAPITGAIVAVIMYKGLNMDVTQRKKIRRLPREVSKKFHSNGSSSRGHANN